MSRTLSSSKLAIPALVLGLTGLSNPSMQDVGTMEVLGRIEYSSVSLFNMNPDTTELSAESHNIDVVIGFAQKVLSESIDTDPEIEDAMNSLFWEMIQEG